MNKEQRAEFLKKLNDQQKKEKEEAKRKNLEKEAIKKRRSDYNIKWIEKKKEDDKKAQEEKKKNEELKKKMIEEEKIKKEKDKLEKEKRQNEDIERREKRLDTFRRTITEAKMLRDAEKIKKLMEQMEEEKRKKEEEKKKFEEEEKKRKEDIIKKEKEKQLKLEEEKKKYEEEQKLFKEERKKIEEQEKSKKEEEESKKKEEEEKRIKKLEEGRKKKLEEEKLKQKEIENIKKEEEENLKKEEERLKKIDDERKKKEEEKKKKKEEEEKNKKEEKDKKKKEEEERMKKVNEERKKKEEEKKIKKEEEERKKKEEEDIKEEEKRIKIEEAKRKREEEKRKREEKEEKRKIEEEEKQKKENEERDKKIEEEKRKREEAKRKREEERQRKEEEKRKEEERKKIEIKNKINMRQYNLRNSIEIKDNKKSDNIILIEQKGKLKGLSSEEIKKETKKAELIEDMSTMGTIMKEEIIKEKETNPEKFISTEEIIEQKSNDQLYALAIFSKALEDQGMVTAIEKNSDEEEKKTAMTNMQFLINGMSNRNKYDLHFDFDEAKTEKLLNDEEERIKFHDKLRKKISKEYNINEEDIIVTFPRKGCYQVSVIFKSEDFNLNEEELKEKFISEKDELGKLKQIQKNIILGGCKLNTKMLDYRGNNKDGGWAGIGEKRGGEDYIPPIGWIGYGLNVLDVYGDNTWIGMNNSKGEWCVAYHGVARREPKEEVSRITGLIVTSGFKSSTWGAATNDEDKRHPGTKCGLGVYCSPDINYAEDYAGVTEFNQENYKCVLMLRINPEKIRQSSSWPKEYILEPHTDEIRPYRILLKKC